MRRRERAGVGRDTAPGDRRCTLRRLMSTWIATTWVARSRRVRRALAQGAA